MCEPISLGAVFASIGSAFKFADVAVRIAEVGTENEVFVRTISVVRSDLQEVERLFIIPSIARKISNIPGKLPWIQNAIFNTKSALNEIGKWVERARSEYGATGEIKFETRVRWVFNDHEKLVNRKTELMACHQQLSNVLGYLLRIEDVVGASGVGVEETKTTVESEGDEGFFDEMMARHRRASMVTGGLKKMGGSGKAGVRASDPQICRGGAPTRAASFPFGSNSGIEDLVDSHDSYHYPLHVQSSPDSIPWTPPPTYSSIVQAQPSENHQNPYFTSAPPPPPPPPNTHQTEKFPFYQPSPPPNTHGTETLPFSAPAIIQELGATPASSPPVKEKLPIIMSGTNTLGPVNPYDFSTKTANTTPVYLPQQNASTALDVSLRNLTIKENPPVHDPGPPPGYPRRAVRKDSQTHKNGNSNALLDAKAYRMQEHHVAELPGDAIAGQTQTQSNPLITSSTFPSHQPQLHSSTHPVFTNPTYELPSTDLAFPAQHIQTRHSVSIPVLPTHANAPASYRLSTQPYINSTAALQTPPTSQIEPTFPPPTTILSSSSSFPTQSYQSGTGTSASLARMRRQKDMMELLGSLG